MSGDRDETDSSRDDGTDSEPGTTPGSGGDPDRTERRRREGSRGKRGRSGEGSRRSGQGRDRSGERRGNSRGERRQSGGRRGGGRGPPRSSSALDTGEVTFSVGVFLAFGLGTALSYFLFLVLLPGLLSVAIGAGGTGSFLALMFGLFLGPAIATITGVATGIRSSETYGATRRATVSAGVGSLAGFVIQFFVLLLLFLVLGSGGAGGGGGGGAIGQLILPILGLTLGVGATGAMAAYASARS